MFDPASVENPTRFVPGRPASQLMHFGFGLHWCVGAFIARAQITQTLKPLVAMPTLRRAEGRSGQLKRTFPVIGFPQRLEMRYAK
jgi:cytochrome P450